MYLEFIDNDGQPAVAVVGAVSVDLVYASGHATIRIYREPEQIGPNARPVADWRFDFGTPTGPPTTIPPAVPGPYASATVIPAPVYATAAQLITRTNELVDEHSPIDALSRAILETATKHPKLQNATLVLD